MAEVANKIEATTAVVAEEATTGLDLTVASTREKEVAARAAVATTEVSAAEAAEVDSRTSLCHPRLPLASPFPWW